MPDDLLECLLVVRFQEKQHVPMGCGVMVGFRYPEAVNLDGIPLELGADASPHPAKVFLSLPGSGPVIAGIFDNNVGCREFPCMKSAWASQGNEHRTMTGQPGNLLEPPNPGHDLTPPNTWVRYGVPRYGRQPIGIPLFVSDFQAL